MLVIKTEGEEFFNERTQEFGSTEGVTLKFEHSLVSLSKWESKHQIPFLGPQEKTPEQVLDYVRCMALGDHSGDIIPHLSSDNLKEINAYVESKQSATTFGILPNERHGRPEIITSELVYYWMVAHNIPFECETWHLNRLFSLIRICNVKNSPKKKMSSSAIAQRNREINAQRRAQLGTSG